MQTEIKLLQLKSWKKVSFKIVDKTVDTLTFKRLNISLFHETTNLSNSYSDDLILSAE